MDEFKPYAKLSKRRKHDVDSSRRGTWHSINPVTRKPPNPKAYNRKKTQKWNRGDDFISASF